MSIVISMVGRRFGNATVVDRAGSNRQGEAIWKCQCDCGNVFITRGSNLRNGVTKSCGCYMAISASRQFTKHGMRSKRIYYVWSSMKARCLNKHCKEYRFYGARGITVCDEWMSASGFIQWALNNGYSDDLTIDRIDNNLGYFPDNCRFIPIREQGRNTRSTIRIVSDDGYLTAGETAKAVGVSGSTIGRWYHAGYVKTLGDAITAAKERGYLCKRFS